MNQKDELRRLRKELRKMKADAAYVNSIASEQEARYNIKTVEQEITRLISQRTDPAEEK